MFRKIIWSERANKERLEILKYWIKRNKSNTYSIKLNQLFKDGLKDLKTLPEFGKPTNVSLVRIKVVRDYLIYYRIQEDDIEIITIWDSRRNPKKFKL